MTTRAIVTLAALLLAGLATADDNGVAWNSLAPEQQKVLARFQGDWSTLTPERQERLALGADRWVHMDAEQRSAAQQRFGQWRKLSDDRRELIRERYQLYKSLSPEEQKRIRENYQRFRELRQERRELLRERFRDMTPEQRQRLRDRLSDRRARPTGREKRRGQGERFVLPPSGQVTDAARQHDQRARRGGSPALRPLQHPAQRQLPLIGRVLGVGHELQVRRQGRLPQLGVTAEVHHAGSDRTGAGQPAENHRRGRKADVLPVQR